MDKNNPTRNPEWTSETAPKGTGGKKQKSVYTIEDIAKITGRALQTVRNDIAKKKLNWRSIKSVAKYIHWVETNKKIEEERDD